MKALLSALALTLIAGSAFAQAPQSNCRVRVDGTETGMVLAWNSFFTYVHQQSQGRRGCSAGRIYHMPNSGRFYVDGRKVGERLSNRDIENLERQYRCNARVYSCDEIGIVRGNEPMSNEMPAEVIILDAIGTAAGAY